jgi:hypothetical protein
MQRSAGKSAESAPPFILDCFGAYAPRNDGSTLRVELGSFGVALCAALSRNSRLACRVKLQAYIALTLAKAKPVRFRARHISRIMTPPLAHV